MNVDPTLPPKAHAPTDKEYTEIIRSDVEVDPIFIQEDGQPAKIIYYCKECKSPVSPKRIGKKLSFKCATCDRDVSFGTETSVQNYYNVKQKQSYI